jgi:hypothetical protein
MATNNITINTAGTGSSGSILVTGAGSNGTWTNPMYTTSASSYTINPVGANPSVQLSDRGIEMADGTDLVIGNVSIKKSLEAIEQRLAILQPNVKLEAEWSELQRLGNEYRALEKEIKGKMVSWDILKK